jgi:hypothetical protein
VGLLSQNARRRIYVPARADWSHFRTVAGGLDDLTAGGDDLWPDHLIELAGSVQKRGMFVLFSDLLIERERVLQALRMLRDRRHEVLLFHVLHPWELEFPFSEPRLFTDPEDPERRALADPEVVRRTYLQRVQELCSFFREEAAGLEVDYHLLPSDSPLERALVQYLARREARSRYRRSSPGG